MEVHLDHDRIPVGNGKSAEKTKGRSLDVLSSIKRSIVAVKAAFLCLVHALIIDLAHVNDDLNTHNIDKETVLKTLLKII